MTRADAWRKRPVVLRYHAFKDALRIACKGVGQDPIEVNIVANISMPASWSKKKRAAMDGKPMRSKPDFDNIAKAICDALWEEDSVIADGSVKKRWTSGAGSIYIEVTQG